jgi:hypothetical protein
MMGDWGWEERGSFFASFCSQKEDFLASLIRSRGGKGFCAMGKGIDHLRVG